jgi:isocitrate/isopropylmalate dehydrogenase
MARPDGPISTVLLFMIHKVTLIPGDGIGPEVIQATVRILEATGVKFEWESFAAGAEAFEKYHEYIPKNSANPSSARASG